MGGETFKFREIQSTMRWLLKENILIRLHAYGTLVSHPHAQKQLSLDISLFPFVVSITICVQKCRYVLFICMWPKSFSITVCHISFIRCPTESSSRTLFARITQFWKLPDFEHVCVAQNFGFEVVTKSLRGVNSQQSINIIDAKDLNFCWQARAIL